MHCPTHATGQFSEYLLFVITSFAGQFSGYLLFVITSFSVFTFYSVSVLWRRSPYELTA